MNVFAQLSVGGDPYSWRNPSLFSERQIPVFVASKIDKSRFEKEDAENEKSNDFFRFSYPHSVNLNLMNSGKWTVLENGDRVWQLKIQCLEATSIHLFFDKFNLIGDSRLFVYSLDRKFKIGGFTTKNNKGSKGYPGKLATQILKSSGVILELYEPKYNDGNVLEVGTIYHGYRSFPLFNEMLSDESLTGGTSGSCMVDVNCSEGALWQEKKNGIAIIQVGSGMGTGTLINNTANDATPYFLTADHNFNATTIDAIGNDDASSCVFYWMFEDWGCKTLSYRGALTTSGVSMISNNEGSDFALLLLTESPFENLSEFIPTYFNGWTRTATPPAGGVGIHHPRADVKKIGVYTQVPETSNYTGIYPVNSHWRVQWVPTANGHTVTDPGSSGSPLMTDDGLIIGQLHGSAVYSCSNPYEDRGIYGRFDASWDGLNFNGTYNTSPQRRLKDWLDPEGTNLGWHPGGYYGNCDGSLFLSNTYNDIRRYKSDNFIYINSTILPTADVLLTADVNIDFNLGFNAQYGSTLNAIIETCTSGWGASIVSSPAISELKPDATMSDLYNEKNIEIFPNPAVNVVNIRFNKFSGERVDIEIIDVNGKVLLGKHYNMSQIGNVLSLDLTTFRSGIYFVRLKTSDFLKTKKIILNK